MEKKEPRVLLELGIDEAKLVNSAMELISRTALGQFDLIEYEITSARTTPLSMDSCLAIREKLNEIARLADLTNLGIFNKNVPESARLSWDIHQVLRRCIAFHEKPEGGIQTQFDRPLLSSKQSSASAKITQKVKAK